MFSSGKKLYLCAVNYLSSMKHKISGKELWMSSRDYLFIIFGTFLYSFAFTGFILPLGVVIGGVTGVGTLIFFLTGIPVAISQYAINLILLAFAFRIVGKQFVMRTIFGTTCMAIWLGIFQPLMAARFPDGILPGQEFMSILIGGFLLGIALGQVFIHNGSTGGTDIVAAMVSKKTNISVGRTMLYTDFCIISSSYLLFHSIDKIVYGLIILFLLSYIVDQLINSNRQAVQFIIFSPRWIEIADAINMQAHRGCTVIDGMGWYTKHEVKLLLVVCRRQESVTMFRIIKSIDPGAFITQGHVSGAYGQGFDQIKLNAKNPKKHKDAEESTPAIEPEAKQ